MSAMLGLKSASVSYGGIRALREVDVAVEEGEIVCLIGANGAGKSTLLRAVAGLVPLSGGEIAFRGASLHTTGKSLPTHHVTALGAALVPEGRGVFGGLTVRENLEMGAWTLKDPKAVKSAVAEMEGIFPVLASRRAQKAGSLSGGEQQMLAVARALMSRPSLLLLDEPSLGLAPLVIRQIFETVVRINRDEGVTVLLVEQNARAALSCSARAYVLETGRVALSGTSAELLADERVKAAYLGE
jgi:branched-chain amino acid transport system ATP-binding protein